METLPPELPGTQPSLPPELPEIEPMSWREWLWSALATLVIAPIAWVAAWIGLAIVLGLAHVESPRWPLAGATIIGGYATYRFIRWWLVRHGLVTSGNLIR